ncbi:glyoxalase [Psychrobacillus vulpis]|uniref:Glyoxalase n=1 Tax=Psychrobacillus vulpis TaxID=2325572 RepID=A0A544TRR0_9BACI|nr:glyoxalase [Psychrobacillus vulpis]TQR20128.1 glyoxalase [Psychrobacillus vulpis]
MFKAVTLYTNKLKQLKGFYGNVLGLNMLEVSKDYFTVAIGSTSLTFRESVRSAFYHFAINIPGNQFTLAKHWAMERVTLNREDGLNEVYYPRFEADSFYFEDPAGNIVEMIARRNVDKWSDFSMDSLLNLSEIGVTTPHVVEVGEQLQDIGIPISGHVEIEANELNFLGSGDTYLLLVPPKRRWYFSKHLGETHPLEIELTKGERLILSEEGKMNIQ